MTKKDVGFWFLFIIVVYSILLVKILNGHTLRDGYFFTFYSFAVTIYIFSRFVLSHFHKSYEVDENYLPSVSFVVPAKNEGPSIRKTLTLFAEVDYPMDKIEVVTINDGSTDDTLLEMKKAQLEIGSKIKRFEVVDWKVNRGKRDGMAEGVKLAKHDIIIFIDSDSFIDKDCVRHLVKYFVNPEVGAVSGHTDVHNVDTNLLTQMQAVRYYIAFKVYKAAESVFGIVTCCPGCCSAYRREYLMEFLDEWLHQTFLGAKCTFGDDRSLTNFIIKKYKATYSPEAKANTIVPDNFRTYLRQQQRWKKSWIRETFIASLFFWKKNPLAAVFFYIYVFLAFASPIVFVRAMFWHPYIYHEWPIIYLIGLFLMLLMHGIYYRIRVGNRSWFLAIASFWLNSILLMWQLPWAFVTMNDTRWGTR
jgi:hyaluronan synthase